MRREPYGTLFVRQPSQIYRANVDGSLQTIPYLPFVEWLREDDYIAAPTGPLQIDADGVYYQSVVGLKDDRARIVRLMPARGVYKPTGNLPGSPESFWLRGVPLWRVGRELFSLDGTHKVNELPLPFEEAAKRAKLNGAFEPLLFSRTETLVTLDTGIVRYEGYSWIHYTWRELSIRQIEVPEVSAAFEPNPRKFLTPEFSPKYLVNSLLFMERLNEGEKEGEAYVLDLNHLNQGVVKRKIGHYRAPRLLMPETAGFLSAHWRKISFYDRDSMYEADDTWEGYWQGFVGFTPYFRPRHHVLRADVD